MARSEDLALAVAAAAAEIQQESTSATLKAITTVAVAAMEEIDHAGITLVHRDGRLETTESSDPFVVQLDAIQYEAHDGPCVTALEDDAEPVTVVEYARHETRWPRFIPAAVQLGLTAQLGIRLFIEDQTIGVLNLYSTTSHTIADDTRQLGELFATHAALAYGYSRKIEDLQGAIATRQVIGQAVGIVMERYELDENRAFDYLVRVSSRSEVKIREVAANLVAGLETPEPSAN